MERRLLLTWRADQTLKRVGSGAGNADLEMKTRKVMDRKGASGRRSALRRIRSGASEHDHFAIGFLTKGKTSISAPTNKGGNYSRETCNLCM